MIDSLFTPRSLRYRQKTSAAARKSITDAVKADLPELLQHRIGTLVLSRIAGEADRAELQRRSTLPKGEIYCLERLSVAELYEAGEASGFQRLPLSVFHMELPPPQGGGQAARLSFTRRI